MNKDYQEILRQRCRDYYAENKEKIKARVQRTRRRIKQETIKHYGGKCNICGEAHIECLTIDHSKGDGGKFRKNNGNKVNGSSGALAGNKFYEWLKKRNFPDNLGLRVLCFNCNCSIGAYGYSPLGGK